MTRESLRKYLLDHINSILTGFLSARLLSQQDKDILHAQYAVIQEDDGTILDKILVHLPPQREG